MGLIEQAIEDISQITTSLNDFGVELTLRTPSNTLSKTIVGLHTKHHMSIDSDGRPVNSRNAHVSFSEKSLDNYPLRNVKGEVSLKGHTVSVKDSTGTTITYSIREWFPDETVGLIVCILGDYA